MNGSFVALIALASTTSPALAQPMLLADADMDQVTAAGASANSPTYLPWIVWWHPALGPLLADVVEGQSASDSGTVENGSVARQVSVSGPTGTATASAVASSPNGTASVAVSASVGSAAK
jgi:hypothetical protein